VSFSAFHALEGKIFNGFITEALCTSLGQRRRRNITLWARHAEHTARMSSACELVLEMKGFNAFFLTAGCANFGFACGVIETHSVLR
jgi:hypothetical protein